MSSKAPGTLAAAPMISVVIPVYNGVRYLAEAVESILGQSYQNFELILADDGSTDASAALIQAFAARDPRIRPLFLAHAGEGATLNAATATARGKWLALLKQDDVALPNRLATQLCWLEERGLEVGGAYAQQFGDYRGIFGFPTTQQAIRHEFLFRIGILDATIMLPTAIAQANPWATDLVIIDYEWLSRLVLRYRVGNLPAILVKYRAHSSQTHVAQRARCGIEMKRCQQHYFAALLPAASTADEQCFQRAISTTPCTSLAELAQTGAWLAQLLVADDRMQHVSMDQRWLALCSRATALGPDCYRLYRHYAPHFHPGATIAHPALRTACTLRLRPRTLPYRLWQKVMFNPERVMRP